MENSNKIRKKQLNNFEDIRDDYNYTRQLNLIRYEENKAKVYESHPKLKDFDAAIIDLYLNMASAINSDLVYKDIESKLASVKADRDKYLKEHNVDDSYLEVKYTCAKCKDTGFVDGNKCSCFVQKEIELFDNISHFKQYIKTDNFENLDTSYYNQDIKLSGNAGTYRDYMRRAIAHMRDSIKEMNSKMYNAIFVGAVGTGKTFLARCIGTECLKNNKSVLYVNVNEYLNSLKPDYDGEPLEQYAVACDLFILDDLGTENLTDFAITKLNYIVDKRLCDNKSTIITTNLVVEELEKRYLNSMLSRIFHIYTKYLLCGEDLRRLKYADA